MNPSQERLHSVDALRGFSLLGILLLNINSFGLPFAAYMNPQVAGGAEGWNLATWLLAMTAFDGKMRCIFSMLFGTSAILLLDRAERRGAGIEAADIYYRRTMWLIVLGLLHAHLIWMGDILYPYGVVGLLLFPLRKLSAKALIITGAVIILIHSLQNLGGGYAIGEMQQQAEAAKKLEAEGKKLDKEQQKTLAEWNGLKELFAPEPAVVKKQIETQRGGWIANLGLRSAEAATFQFTMFFQFMFLDVLGMLVLGMGLAKAGWFDASRSYAFYTKLTLIGFGVGLPLNFWAAKTWADADFSIPVFMGVVGATTDPGRFLVAGGYVGLVMMACKAGWRWLTVPLARVGQTALSNYLLTSILMTFYFNGYGLGMFARLERWQLMFWIVPLMWIINLSLSALWLQHFRFGPAEWAWRSLTYWQKQPWRWSPATPSAAPASSETLSLPAGS